MYVSLLHVCSVVSYETSVMDVVECDQYCHQYSGCSERGEGKCDHFCVDGRGIDPSNYTCMGEYNYRAMLCIRGTSHGPVSVCVCVRLSLTRRCSTKTAKQRITQTTPHDSPGYLVF